MLTTVKGVFEDGRITLSENPSITKKMEVIVTFIDEIPATPNKRRAGILSGKIWMSDDFDAPLDDLKDYM
ncbi:DUF2281 domain-containing protein [Dyadobacter sp. 32]|uniref:DUF2281 domain-containing protein n=1 Tax=Dyadobacter sp. 32 TaxID=538966 RepID=UPI0011EFA9F0